MTENPYELPSDPAKRQSHALTDGYERAGAYLHLGSTTIGTPSEKYKEAVLRNGQLFHARWDATIARTHARRRRTWLRKATPAGWIATAARMARQAVARAGARP